MQRRHHLLTCAAAWGAMLTLSVTSVRGGGETVDRAAGDAAGGTAGGTAGGAAREAETGAVGRVDPRIDPLTGRDRRVWPPDRPFDHLHMTLELTIPDMAEDRFTARETLIVTPIGLPRRALELNAGKGLQVRSVSVDGLDASFTHEDEILRVSLPRDVRPGERAEVVIEYGTDGPGGGGGGGAGLTWSADDPATEVFDPMYHAQGEAESNRLWFPCHDFPNDRLTSELIVTVPEGFEAISNGRLASQEQADGATTFHWVQDEAHVPYLVTVVIGVFDRVDVGESPSAGGATGAGSAAGEQGADGSVAGGAVGRPAAAARVPMPVYGPVGSAATLQRQFADTPAMVAYFEELFDEPFPWAKYAQIYVRDFAAGAMENTSATTINSSYLDEPEGSWEVESIIAHELAHQWFGDLVTCRSWEHLWLNEGWASYCEAVWAQQKARLEGKTEAEAREAYLDVVRDHSLSELAMSRLGVPDQAPMANSVYRSPDDRFGGPNGVYSKGCVTLHMLHEMLGDELFWQGVRLYLDRHKQGLVETSDFRRAMEDATGRSLEQFFQQWVYRPGHPRLTVDLIWRPAGGAGLRPVSPDASESGELRAIIMQTQTIDGNNPAFAFDLPIHIELPGSSGGSAGEPAAEGSHDWRIHVDERITTVTLPLAARPERVRVNPDLAVLAQIKVTGDWPQEHRPRYRHHEPDASPAEENGAAGVEPGQE